MLQATSFDKLCNPVSQADTNIFTSNSLHHKTLPFRHVSLFHTCNWLLLPSFSEYRNAFLFASIASPTLEKLLPTTTDAHHSIPTPTGEEGTVT